MKQGAGLPPRENEIAGLVARRDALRQAAGLRGARLRPTLEAALAELDAAIDTLTAAIDRRDGSPQADAMDALHAERRLLRALFQEAPVALFLVEIDGTVRRVNRAAGELLDTGSGYATGRPFTAFVDLPSRAAVDSQLAAVIRTGTTRSIQCELLTGDGTAHCELTISLARLRGDEDHLIIAARESAPAPAGGSQAEAPRRGNGRAPVPGKSPASDRSAPAAKTAASAKNAASAMSAASAKSAGSAKAARSATDAPAPHDTPPAHGAGDGVPSPVVTAMTRRLDLMTAVARLLLEKAPLSETVVFQRCARLLADQLSAWVIVDVARDRRLHRQTVAGGQDERAAELARVVAAHDPPPGSLPWTVHESGSSQLIARAEELMLLGATSVLCVPLADGQRPYGTLTLARHASTGHFGLADLGLVEEIGEQLALAVSMDRTVRRHSQIASALRDSLMPRHLPVIPGVEVATAHLPVTGSPEVGGDFFDVYRTPSGWGVAIGDASGRGDGVAAVSAAARHAIRVVAHSTADPIAVLSSANEIVLAEEFRGRFVTACTAHLQWREQTLEVSIGCAGHPAPLLIRPDGRVRQLKGGGLPLGIFPDAGPSAEDHELSPGDVLLFYSDGLADARKPEAGYFDEQLPGEVAALAGEQPGHILARLQEVALGFCAGVVRDDITLLALRVGEPPD